MSELQDLEALFDSLWPILRSITGDGVRTTHDLIGDHIPLERHEVPSGTPVLDWTVPKEWVCRKAYLVAPDGQRILDVHDNNLHLVNYSAPYSGAMSLDALQEHLYSLPDQPDAIPYVTRYYKREWGFCLSQRQRDSLQPGEYQVEIDTDHIDGSLTISECVIPGESSVELLVHTYTCHPSLANNELSGPLVATFLAKRLLSSPRRRYTYRFVFAPESIGAVTYLAMRGDHLRKHLLGGLIATCVGDAGGFTYKRSRQGDNLIDRAVEQVINEVGLPGSSLLDFSPSGSDERQYCSPGFKLPVGSLMRTKYGQYPQYHTSLDNKEFISFEALNGTIDAYEAVFDCIENNRTYESLKPDGEPQLSKYVDFYGTSDLKTATEDTMAAKWCIHYCDGDHDLLDIAARSGLPMAALARVAAQLAEVGVLRELPPS